MARHINLLIMAAFMGLRVAQAAQAVCDLSKCREGGGADPQGDCCENTGNAACADHYRLSLVEDVSTVSWINNGATATAPAQCGAQDGNKKNTCCQAPVACTCPNGTPTTHDATENACPAEGGVACSACNAGFTLVGTACKADLCTNTANEPSTLYPCTCGADLTATAVCEAGSNCAGTVCEATTVTTTATPWDSSESSSGDSDSLDSSYSSSFKEDSSGDTSESSYESSGSEASGSSGSYMPIWMWMTLLACLTCALCGALAGMMGGKKKKPVPKKKPQPKAPEPKAPEPVVEVPALIPTTTSVIPSYSMAVPTTTAYAAPVSYAQPVSTAYAAPATAAYAAPMAYPTTGVYSTGAVV